MELRQAAAVGSVGPDSGPAEWNVDVIQAAEDQQGHWRGIIGSSGTEGVPEGQVLDRTVRPEVAYLHPEDEVRGTGRGNRISVLHAVHGAREVDIDFA